MKKLLFASAILFGSMSLYSCGGEAEVAEGGEEDVTVIDRDTSVAELEVERTVIDTDTAIQSETIPVGEEEEGEGEVIE